MPASVSLFLPLEREGLTTLLLYYHRRQDRFFLRAAREWDEDRDWSAYTRDFSYEDPLTDRPRYMGPEETRELFRRYGLEDYLQQVLELLRRGRHQAVECLWEPRRNLRFFNFMHSSTLGLANGQHAIRSGGIRRHEPEEPELEVIVDGLNLARAMSYKNAAAQIPYGGSKLVVQSRYVEVDDLSALGFLAYAIDRSRSFTGPDMGFTPQHADVLRRHFTRNITGGSAGPLGPTGGPTAYGLLLAIKEAAEVAFGTPSLAGRTVAIQGLGAVGYPLAEHLLAEGAALIVADVDRRKVASLQSAHPAVKAVAPEEIIYQEADIFAPCAVGGIIGPEVIPRLRFKVILGAANNQLRATSKEEEIALARALAERGILFQIDWMHNLAGVLAGWEEYRNQEKASLENLKPHLERVCRDAVRENLRAALAEGITPTERAYRLVEEKIYGRG
ncbi:MAG: Glu/Leu/Phe/Val dehydrogenase family protein [Moorellales bacterium]